VLEVLYNHAKFGGTRISPAAGVAKYVEFFTGNIALSASRQYIFTERPILRFFAPQGRHIAPMVVTFGTEEWTEDPLLHAKFHPHRCNDKGVGPQKLKILLRFFQNVEYKRPAGAYPLHARFS